MIKLPKPELIALDLDLTIYDIIEIYEKILNEVRVELGMKSWTKEEFNYYHHNKFITNYTSFKEIFHDQERQAFRIYYNKFHEYTIPASCELTGAREMLNTIKSELNIPIIAVTNSEQHMAKKSLKDLDLSQYFKTVTGMKEDRRPKPDSHLLEIGLKKTNATHGKHIWFMGDSNTDTLCAKRLGCTAIKFNKDGASDLHDDNADATFYNFKEFVQSIRDSYL